MDSLVNSLPQDIGFDETFIDMMPNYLESLPPDSVFDDDKWNIHSWITRKQNSKTRLLNFQSIKHQDLQILVKIYILSLRTKRCIVAGSAKALISPMKYLSDALGSKTLEMLNDSDFFAAEEMILANHNKSAPHRMAGYLQSFASWVCAHSTLRITYHRSTQSRCFHGRMAMTDQDRESKLISTEVLAALLGKAKHQNITPRDKFCIAILSLLIPTGARLNELLTSPRDCLHYEEGNLAILMHPEKKSRLPTRPIMSSFAPVVIDAYEYILSVTEPGRKAVDFIRQSQKLDWTMILRDKNLTRYSVKTFAHEWTSNEQNFMFNKFGAWCEKHKRYIDIIKLKGEFGSFVKLADHLKICRSTLSKMAVAQERALKGKLPYKVKNSNKGNLKARISWDTDSRVISFMALESYAGRSMPASVRPLFADIIEDARENYQLRGQIYPEPKFDSELESKCTFQPQAIVEMRDGTEVLAPENCLFIIPKYLFSDTRRTDYNRYQLIDYRFLSSWLCGESRSRGTKNFEDSVFSRLNIIDPKTGEIAKFTSHDVRHWFDTYLAEGGLDEETIALIFNRTKSQNAVYDQTLSITRLSNMRKAIRDGTAIGGIPDIFVQLSKHSIVEAECYLAAETLMVTILPHGACTLNWSLESCPHANSCLNTGSGGDGPSKSVCKHFIFDRGSDVQVSSLKGIAIHVESSLSVMPKDSPQIAHFEGISRNARYLLSSVSK